MGAIVTFSPREPDIMSMSSMICSWFLHRRSWLGQFRCDFHDVTYCYWGLSAKALTQRCLESIYSVRAGYLARLEAGWDQFPTTRETPNAYARGGDTTMDTALPRATVDTVVNYSIPDGGMAYEPRAVKSPKGTSAAALGDPSQPQWRRDCPGGDWFYDSPLQNQRFSLLNVSWLLHTKMDAMKTKSLIYFLVGKGPSNDDVWVGCKGYRISGDTAGSWFQNRRFR